jgi:SAM-dependent methyltransferase
MYLGNKSNTELQKICMTVGDKNILFYDSIAEEYDGQMSSDEKNKYVRQLVAGKFIEAVKGPVVLDFGGGTGQDLGWLLKNKYRIIFCEPSRAMRHIAQEREKLEFPNSGILFFEEKQSDFKNWTNSFPFEQKVDAVLANFAVLNCIKDIDHLFEKLAIALKPGGHFFALVLDIHILHFIKSHPFNAISSVISGKPVRLLVNHNSHQQEVYVHSVTNIRKACSAAFNLVNQIRLNKYGFRLIHLLRK